MLNLVKGILVGSVGLGGGIGVAMYGALSPSNSSTAVSKEKELKVVSSGPVLVCDDNYDKYEFFLELANDSEKDMGIGITLRVYKTSETGDKKTIPWGDKAVGNHAWGNWKMTFTGEEINSIWTKELGMGNYHSNYMIHGCTKGGAGKNQLQMQLTDISKNQGDEKGIEGSNIKFEIDESSCKQESNTKECEIKFSSDNNLKWKKGFQPKIFYTTAQ